MLDKEVWYLANDALVFCTKDFLCLTKNVFVLAKDAFVLHKGRLRASQRTQVVLEKCEGCISAIKNLHTTDERILIQAIQEGLQLKETEK